MSVPIILTLFVIFCAKLLGVILYKKITKPNTSSSNYVAKLIQDSLNIFSYRVTSSILQIILYTSLVLIILATIFSQHIPYTPILAFFIGGIIMIITFKIVTNIIPKIIPCVIKKSKTYFHDSLSIQYDFVTILGITMTSIVILGLISCYIGFGIQSTIGYALGILLASFFLRIGGSLYKTGSDLGTTLSKKINKDIPKDNSKNPGTILDLSGDCIGKLIGFSSDIIGSFILSFIACLFFADALESTQLINSNTAKKLIHLPFLIIATSYISTLVAYGVCKYRIKNNQYTNILLEGLYITLTLCTIGTYMIIELLDIKMSVASIWGGNDGFSPFFAYTTGIIGAVLISFTSELLTSNNYKTTKKHAGLAEFGNTITTLNAFSIGFISNGLYLIYILLIAIASFRFAGFYGIALASFGMLSNIVIITIVNSFNSFSSTTYQVALLSNTAETPKSNIAKCDNLGQTSVAIGSGFLTGSAIIASFALFFSIILTSQNKITNLFNINLEWLIGLIMGSIIPLIICGFLLHQLNKISINVIKEIRRQFNQIPYLKEGKANPDMEKASELHSTTSMDALILPGILMALIPICLGFIVNLKICVAYCLGTILTGLLCGFTWGNIGDISKSAKHYIKKGHYGGQHSPNYTNIENADLLGDAHKHLLSPSMNIIMKTIIIITATVMLFLNIV